MNKKGGEFEILGTKEIKEASPFCVVTTASSVHKLEFYIQYYHFGLRYYVLCNGDLFGNNDGPLTAARDNVYNDAHYVLHSQERHRKISLGTLRFPFTTMPCTYDPSPVDEWLGDEFYINCSRRRFKVNGYLAMERYKSNSSNDAQATQTYGYKLVSVGVPESVEKERVCALFSLVSRPTRGKRHQAHV